MMSAGYKGNVKFKISDGSLPVFSSSDKVDGSFSFDNSSDVTQLEKTELGNDWNKFEEGLKDLSGSVNIYINESIDLFEESGLGGLITAIAYPQLFEGKKAWIENRSNDYFALAFSIVIQSFSITSQTEDRVTITINWKGAGDFKFYEVQRTNFDLQNVENYVLQNLTNFDIQYRRDVLPISE
jgi:hypothetical protein